MNQLVETKSKLDERVVECTVQLTTMQEELRVMQEVNERLQQEGALATRPRLSMVEEEEEEDDDDEEEDKATTNPATIMMTTTTAVSIALHSEVSALRMELQASREETKHLQFEVSCRV